MFFASIALWVVAFFFAIGVLVAYIRTRREPEPWAVIDHAAVTRDAVVVGVLLVVMGARASYVPLVINPAPDFALAISKPFRCHQ
jgi:prolipoprotein diacylglyceryltransferase